MEAYRRDYSRSVSSFGLDEVDTPEYDGVWVRKGFAGVKKKDLANTVCRIGIIPGNQRRERTSLDAWSLKLFERMWNISFSFVDIIFSLGFDLGNKSLVLLSASNTASLRHVDVVGEEINRDNLLLWINGDSWKGGLEFVLLLVYGGVTVNLVDVASRTEIDEQSIGVSLEGKKLCEDVESDNSLEVKDEWSSGDSWIIVWKILSFIVCLRCFVEGGVWAILVFISCLSWVSDSPSSCNPSA